MSESGTAATPDGTSSIRTIDSGHDRSTRPRARAGRPRPAGDHDGLAGTLIIAVLACLWLVAMLRSVHASIVSLAGIGPLTLAATAQSLPSVISSGLVAGAGIGMLATSAAARRGRPADGAAAATGPAARRRDPAVRYALGTLSGLLAGGAAALAILIAYGRSTPIIVLAASVGVTGAAGGALAGLAARRVLAAGLAGTLAAFGTGFALNFFREPLLRGLGAGATVGSQSAAVGRLAWGTAVVIGLVAGAVGYAHLGRAAGRARWLGYMLAGATPGVLVLVSELAARVTAGVAFGLGAVVSVSDIDYALVVLFLGALLATILYGRSLPRPQRPGPE